mmetsp:Transcript_20285/g.29772  ORF Transcript_20285/g.29772 Transcript_20285/m.29772 type:complete len:159 (+) Transcript_20285:347-823(+)
MFCLFIISALRGIFSLFDTDDSGYISTKELKSILEKIGHKNDDAASVIEVTKSILKDPCGRISFDTFLQVLERGGGRLPSENPDPKAMEFMRILEQYRVKCEGEGDYLEAKRANAQLEVLRCQEEDRQKQAIRARQIEEIMKVQIAHNKQYNDFNAGK